MVSKLHLSSIRRNPGYTHLLAGEVDTHSTFAQKASVELVLVTGDTSDDYIAKRHNILQGLSLEINNLMRLLLQTLTTRKLLHTSNVNRVNAGTIVSQQRRKRAANDLGAVHDANSMAMQAVSVRQNGVVDVEVLEDLDVGQGSARQNGLLALGLTVQESDVLVHVEDVAVAQAFHVFGHVHNLLQVLVLTGVEDGVVDNDAVDSIVGVRIENRLLDVVAGHLTQGVLESTEKSMVLIDCPS